MRYLRLSMGLSAEVRHPMHQFVTDRGGYGAYWLLHWRGRPDGEVTMLFYVEGPVDPYVAALEERTEAATHSVTTAAGDGFYIYARTGMNHFGRGLVSAVDRTGVLVVPPVEYRTDGSMVASLVGPPDALAGAAEDLPESVDASVLELGPYAERSLRTAGELTERQREVVAAAVDVGYYEEPREATLADVAAVTDCTPSTAAEHLRKAEAAVMERAATGPVTPSAVSPDRSRDGDAAGSP